MSSSSPARARRGLSALACAGTAALAFALVPAIPAAAVTPPVLDPVVITPSGPPGYNGVGGSPAAYTPTISTGNQGWWLENEVMLNFSATDDVAVDFFRVTVGNTPAVDVDATFDAVSGKYVGSYNLVGNRSATTITYAAWDSDETPQASANRTVSIRQDSVAPVATWPTVSGNSWKVSRSWAATALAPTRADATPGSGGAAVRGLRLDGADRYFVPIEPASLSLGAHTLEVDLGDSAGNGATYSLTFEVTTSYADVLNIIADFERQGKYSTTVRDELTALITAAQTAAGASDNATAIAALEDFIALAAAETPQGSARDALVGDAERLRNDLLGIPVPSVTGGVVVTAGSGAPRYDLQLPTAAPVVQEDPEFKVLVFANRPGGFRHEHIPFTEKLIMDLAEENNFDADLFDYVSPDDSVANPFDSIERLSQYDAIIGVSSVGSATFITNRPSIADPAVTVNEQAVLQQYIQAGGGFIAIHGATDSMNGWAWYGQLTGGYFHNHGSNQGGIQSTCGGCVLTELVTEDGSNAATDQFARSRPVLDELYNWNSTLMPVPRQLVHVLQTITESSYDTTVYTNPETNLAYPQNLYGVNNIGNSKEGADHPISWCQNFDGGRSFTQALMHNWELNKDPDFIDQIREAILWTSGQTEANCVSHNEIGKIVDGAGAGLSSEDVTALNTALDASFADYAAKDYAGAEAEAQNLVTAVDASTATGELRALLEKRADELVEWMGLLADGQVTFGFQSEPADATTTTGVETTFSAEATGNELQYQWQSRADKYGTWADISGATSSTLSVTPTSSQDGSQYRVRITSGSNALNSAAAVLTVTPTADDPSVERVFGPNRFATAVEISKASYPDGADVVYIANGQNYPDALSAGPAAAHEGGPLLLVNPHELPSIVAAELDRLDPDRIVVVGGLPSVNTSVFVAINGYADTVDRIAGRDRFETSRMLTDYAFGADGSDVVYIATGQKFPDALSAGGAAGANDAPVILVNGGLADLDPDTAALLGDLGAADARVLGSNSTVSDGIFADIDDLTIATRLAGPNRYATSQIINADAFASAEHAFLITGENFPDALAGSAWAGAEGSPLYASTPNCVPAGVLADLKTLGVTKITLLGGEPSLSASVFSLTPCG